MSETSRSATPPLVLVANDQEWSARSLESILGPHGFAVVRAYTGRQTLDLARRTQPDLVILDAGMPDLAGVEICRMLREDPQFSQSTPVVITTSGPASRTQRLDAYRAGAWEFFTQPIDSEALLLKLDVFVKAKRAHDRSRDESLLDLSTGLYNVRGLAKRAREIGAEATRRRSALACVVIAPQAELRDDSAHAEQYAAQIVDHLSEICRRTARTSDAVGHLGRSEFAIIAPATDMSGALRLVERLQEMIESTPISVGGREQHLRVRAGYCAVPDFAESSVDAVELLLRAATALRHQRSGSEMIPAVTAFEELPIRFVG